jgi:hypothetical protein
MSQRVTRTQHDTRIQYNVKTPVVTGYPVFPVAIRTRFNRNSDLDRSRSAGIPLPGTDRHVRIGRSANRKGVDVDGIPPPESALREVVPRSAVRAFNDGKGPQLMNQVTRYPSGGQAGCWVHRAPRSLLEEGMVSYV